jgi:predicted RNA methylase
VPGSLLHLHIFLGVWSVANTHIYCINNQFSVSELMKLKTTEFDGVPMEMADAKKIRPSATWFEKRAVSLRKEMAMLLSAECRNEEPLSTHFSAYADHLPLPNGVRTLGFNEAVTRTALDAVLLDGDPYIVAFLGSKLVERTFFDIFDFDRPNTPCRNLSVAKRFGVFFTPTEIAMHMASWPISDNSKVLDPCCGAGALLASVMLSNLERHPNLCGIELDPFIAECAQKILKRVQTLTNYKGEVDVRCGDGLHELIELARDTRPSVHVLINPPYGRLRVTQDSLKNIETALIDAGVTRRNSLSSQMERDVKELRKLFPDETGLLEISRLFFRLCGELVSKGATACIISPDAWLSSRDSAKVRQFMIEKRLIHSIYLIREDKGGFSTVNQALAITCMKKSGERQFSIHELKGEKAPFVVGFDEMTQRVGASIPKIPGTAAALFNRLREGLKLKDKNWIKNARGELDQTAAKKIFVADPTTIPLIRGDHVSRFSVSHKSSKGKLSAPIEY